jgi:putative ABC transport system ATP-binding protein
MLSLNDVTLGYDGKPVLHMGTLHIPRGGKCLISGASGSGKTTLLYTVAGLLPVISGSISINGTDLTKLSEPERDHFRGLHMGVIFQTLHLVRSLSVIDNLMLAYFAAGVRQDKARALHMLHRLQIEDKKDALPEHLSQGQAQRVAIARAVLLRPTLILADEPTSSLDDKSCARVIDIIIQIAEEAEAALLVSTHDNRIKAHFSQVMHFEESQ